MYGLYPLIAEYLDGCTASGLFEARLGQEEMGKENHVFAPAYREEEIDEIIELCDHIVFNSFSQLERYRDRVLNAGKSIGLRINPEYSTQEGSMYNPCATGSRFGVTMKEWRPDLLEGVEGLHFHTLCQQGFNDLWSTFVEVEHVFGKYLHNLKWINFGGGHWITHKDYNVEGLENFLLYVQRKYDVQVYLEPGEAVVLNAGQLITSVLDTMKNGIDIAIVDASATCHMPDVLEMPYRPKLAGSGQAQEKAYTYRLGGPTCLTGDVIGDYSFDVPLRPGDRLIFEDMAQYTMVKNTTFNGMALPAIALKRRDGSYKIAKTFNYNHFKGRLN
jgi:carboxynorspermidine decarboxylase